MIEAVFLQQSHGFFHHHLCVGLKNGVDDEVVDVCVVCGDIVEVEIRILIQIVINLISNGIILRSETIKYD